MKRFIASAIVSIVFLSAASAHTLVVFGDSVTAPRSKTEGYAQILSDELTFGGKAIEIVNAGIPGNTTAQALKRIESDVIQKRPDTAVVMFGINDAAVDVWKNPPATQSRVPLAEYRSNLQACITTIKAAGARVVLMTPTPLSWSETTLKLYGKPPYLPDDPEGLNIILKDYAEAVRELAREHSVGLVDLFQLFKTDARQGLETRARLFPDGMHPSSEAHRLIALRLMTTLSTLDSKYTRNARADWITSGQVNEIHPLAKDITHDTANPAVLGPALARLKNGSVLSVFSTPTSYSGKPGECFIASRVTHDGGKSWDPVQELTRLPNGRAAHPTVLRARDGVLHLFFLGFVKFEWDKNHLNPTPNCRSDLWTARSNDEGQTWSKPQRIFEGYTGATNGAEQTRDGRIVVPFSYYTTNPGRLLATTVSSADGGTIWKTSNPIDIGGAGDHDGALEPCVIELRDGRLWMVIRTTRNVLWESFSSDGGQSWTPAQPTTIDSTSAPAHIVRLRDGQLLMAWNRAEGGRRLLHLAFSPDDGKSWTPSWVAVRGSATYPFVLEPEPGDLWIGYMDAHKGWNSPTARHMRVAQKDVLEAIQSKNKTKEPTRSAR